MSHKNAVKSNDMLLSQSARSEQQSITSLGYFTSRCNRAGVSVFTQILQVCSQAYDVTSEGKRMDNTPCPVKKRPIAFLL